MPAVKLTKRLIETFAPQAKLVELWDTQQRGLLCKITPAGNRVFMVFYRTAAGVKRKPRIGSARQITLAQAREAARQMLGEVALGRDPSVDRQQLRRAPDVHELCTRYLRDVAEPHLKPSSLKQYRRMVTFRLRPALGTMKVAAVTRADITALHNRLRVTPTEANRVLALASVIFNQAALWGLRPEGSNPARGIKRFREPPRRERLLTDDEVERLHRAGPSLAIRLLFATGCRAGEILALRGEFIDRETGVIRWPDSKTGPMIRPLTVEISRLLTPVERVGLVFPDLTLSRLDKSWRRLLALAGVPPCGLHTIRHRVITEIANAGLPLQVAMALTGHRTAAAFLRYCHSDRAQTPAAAERVSARRPGGT
jgi:integrase